MQDQPNPQGPRSVVCQACGSPRVAIQNEGGEPLCAMHAALELGGRDGQQTGIFELLEVIGRTIAQDGLASPADAIRAFCEAIGAGEARREQLNLRPVPNFEANLAALTALTAADRRDDTTQGEDDRS